MQPWSILQVINALKNWHSTHHDYMSDTEAQIELCTDSQIRIIENLAKRSSQALKAVGASSGYKVPVLAALADNTKHNQNGHLNEHGALQHYHIDVCPIGSIAFLYFSIFHILSLPPPDFVPDFTDSNYGQYSHHGWYKNHIFFMRAPEKAMSYDTAAA
ncbi:hypothetical protein A0H81_05426 [Grifola frondosa]|uniref:Ndc10 domain-containing protein n=1 Tax=Grifola frondosa TaxID=5627 RepID=A0A1C7MCW6_GRIFR|nr:hypothetical protein A0H81_05426 [Grifola frondosa]